MAGDIATPAGEEKSSGEDAVPELPGVVGPVDTTGPAFSESQTRRRLAGREFIRAGALYALLLIFFVTLIWAFFSLDNSRWMNAKDLLQLILPAETALLGSAFGFYFGTRAKDE